MANGFVNDDFNADGDIGGATATITGACGCGQLNADNIRLDGNSMTITNSNGELNVNANGTGDINIRTPALNTAMLIDDSGRITQPLQVAFTSHIGSTQNTQTGDGTLYTYSSATEDTDVGSNFNNSTGVFTAPLTGYYLLEGYIWLNSIDPANHTLAYVEFNVGSGTILYRVYQSEILTGMDDLIVGGSKIVKLTATNTVTLDAKVTGSAKTVDIGGATTNRLSTFCGYLLG